MNQEKDELLLFDDEPDTAEIVVDTLSGDFEVTFCSTETQLRDVIEHDRFCVIVCDVNIQSSNKTGYEIIDEIREKYNIRKIPVGVYSAVRNIPEIKKSQGTYYDFYVEKAGNWGEKLLAECIKACAKERRYVFADVYERLLEDNLEEKLDVTLDSDYEIMGVYDTGATIKTALEQLRQKVLDEGTESVYMHAIEMKHKLILARK